jgi:hypothetical protein
MPLNALSRAARYREISAELLLLSTTDRANSLSLDNRAQLAAMANEFRIMAAKIEDELGAN